MNRQPVPAQGVALSLYALVLPIIAVWQWNVAASSAQPVLIRCVVLALVLLWLGFLWQLRLALRAIRSGLVVPGTGYQWLATTLIALLPLLGHQQTRHSPPPDSTATSPSAGSFVSDHSSMLWLSSLPLALSAKRLSDSLRQQPTLNPDLVINQLRQRDPSIESHILSLCGKDRAGVVTVTTAPTEIGPSLRKAPPTAAYISAQTPTSASISFVRAGGVLAIPEGWTLAHLQSSLVGLHDGRLVITSSDHELLRALALHSSTKTLVLHLSTPDAVDPEIAALCATLSRPLLVSEPSVGPAPRVRMLQASPDIEQVAHPLDSSLRRRMIEMASYLTLHKGEPVTGDRLRSRVLQHAGVDASPRVLANVASALRRSLGSDHEGTRLHPVSAAGLYLSHGVTSDVEEFHELIERARASFGGTQLDTLREALQLVMSEPLASSLRGFEWFIAEGHQAKLSRDGEWAALALSDLSLRKGDVELAFWAIRQGLLLDPYSDDLAEALTAIPRLREFGGNRPSATQHQPIGAGGAIAVRWALTSLRQEIR